MFVLLASTRSGIWSVRKRIGFVSVSCFHPLRATQSKNGTLTFKSNWGVREATPGGRLLDLPCGQCLGCRISQSQSWRLRMVHESTLHKRNCFITLTFDTDFLRQDWSLDKRDWQLFAKRLRKARGPFRYFAVGEYGEQSLRPHWHALIFGLDFTADQVERPSSSSYPLFSSPSLEKLWGKGLCSSGSVTAESAGYVARYCLKKQSWDHRTYERFNPRTGEFWSVEPEKAYMSRRPGLGADWYLKWHPEVERTDDVWFEGRTQRPPSYYDRLAARMDSRAFEGRKSARQLRARAARASLPAGHAEAKESHAIARQELKRGGVI